MKNQKLIPLEEAAKEWFTKEEIEELDKKVEQRIALRKIEELRQV